MKLAKNMGITDRAVRTVGGLVLGYMVYAEVVTGTLALLAALLGAVLVLTSIVAFCPPYALFGWSTRKVNPAQTLSSVE